MEAYIKILKRDIGVKAVNLASSYHAGFFLHPHNPTHKMYFALDGVVYFQPRMDLYRKTKLKPLVAEVSREVDWFKEVGENLETLVGEDVMKR